MIIIDAYFHLKFMENYLSFPDLSSIFIFTYTYLHPSPLNKPLLINPFH